MIKETKFDYELIDCGNFSKIERFGQIIIDRPCLQADWNAKITDFEYDVFFEKNDRNTKWVGANNFAEFWEINILDEIKAELRFSKNGQVGIFPEQYENWKWIKNKISKTNRNLKILNTFAYTGLASLAASNAHTEVVHVDGAKSAINWAKRNAEISGKSNNKIRWIHDDVRKFLAREIRRKNKYDGVILDPPAFGRGKKGDWKISRDLPELMDMVEKVLIDKPLFVILTCHASEHFLARDLAKMLENLKPFHGQKAEIIDLEIPAKKGHSLSSSFGARISF